ncbi:MAG TPA: MBL fold metallo-hydrolase [Opitutaceae bacterium]|jgi:hydroxyacylglutathione hydrolase|nr:MBL fold metallo-hydrolase [Opitutaceae bacterium]
MAKIPIEDTFADVINKAQRGLQISDADLCAWANVSAEDLAAVKAGKPLIAVIRRVARHLRLAPNPLESIARKEWYPTQPVFPRGFAMFNTDCGDMTVNNYVVWDVKSNVAAVFDTGANCDELLNFVKASRLEVHYIFITHTHEDHIAALDPLVKATRAQVWSHELEPVALAGAKVFKENSYFHLGEVAIKTLKTSGHSPGMTTFYITGLSWPLAIVGDSVFAGSMGGSATAFREQYENDIQKIMNLPRDTVIAPGHGPLTTVAQEKLHNPFFASRTEKNNLSEIISKPNPTSTNV